MKLIGAGAGSTSVWRSDKTANVTRRVFSINDENAWVEGFSITNGVVYGADAKIEYGGGGVLIGAKGGTLANCVVEQCVLTRKAYGAGVAMIGAKSVVTNCIVRSNKIRDHQCKCAGLAMQAGLVVDTEISGNGMPLSTTSLSANGGGYLGAGAYATGGTFSGCTIKDNTGGNGDDSAPTFKGAGLYVNGAVTVTNTTVSGNFSLDGFGGGIYHAGGKLKVVDSQIVNNEAPSGSGIYSAGANGNLTLERCVVTNNYSWLDNGVDSPNVYYPVGASPTIADCTIGGEGAAAEETRVPETFVVSAKTHPDQVPVYPYSSWETAATDIQAAIDATAEGGVCTVDDGTYDVCNQLILDRGVTVVSRNGREVTTLNGKKDATLTRRCGAYRAALLNHPDAVLKGFTLKGGGNFYNYVMYASAVYGTLLTVGGKGGLVADCVLSGNGCGSRNQGEIYLAGAQAVVSNCLVTGSANDNFHKPFGYLFAIADGLVTHTTVSGNRGKANSSGTGFAAYMTGGRLSHCKIVDNTCDEVINGTVYLANANAVVDNTLIAGNVLGSSAKAKMCGGGVYATAGRVVNCTIVGNTAGNGGGVWANNANVKVHNTIIQDNECFTSGANFLGTAAVYTYSLCPDDLPTADSGNLKGSAVFEQGSRYQLASGSPGFDEGSSESYAADQGTTDLDGNDRVWGEEIDIGCFEFFTKIPFSGSIIAPSEPVLAGRETVYEASLVNPQELDLKSVWTVEGLPSAAVTSETYTVTFAEPGDYAVLLVVTDGEIEYVATNYVHVTPVELFVVPPDPEHQAVYPYDSWAKAATNLLDAALEATDGCTVHLAPGVHPITNEVAVNSRITYVGDEGAERTTVRRKSNDLNYDLHRLFNINHEQAVVRGLTLTGGRLTLQQSRGAGVHIGGKGGTLADCVVRGNTMQMNMYTYGVGVYMYAGLVTNCLVCCNTNWTYNTESGTPYAAGIGLAGGTVRDSRIEGNQLLFYGASVPTGAKPCGAGVGFDGTASMVNCLISGNHAFSTCGGVAVAGGHPALTNCTIVGNSCGKADVGAGAFVYYIKNESDLELVNCAFSDNTSAGDVRNISDVGITQTSCAEVTLDSFRNPAKGDYRLCRGSPCIDAGLNADWMAGAKDLCGERRVVNGKVDVGCYEFPWHGLMLMVK